MFLNLPVGSVSPQCHNQLSSAEVKSCVCRPCRASWTPAPRNQTRTHTGSTLMCLLCESNSVIYGQPSWNRCVSNRQTSLLIKHQMALIGLEWITCLLSFCSSFWCSPECLLPLTYWTVAFMVAIDVWYSIDLNKCCHNTCHWICHPGVVDSDSLYMFFLKVYQASYRLLRSVALMVSHTGPYQVLWLLWLFGVLCSGSCSTEPVLKSQLSLHPAIPVPWAQPIIVKKKKKPLPVSSHQQPSYLHTGQWL